VRSPQATSAAHHNPRILISDENKKLVADVEKSIRVLRAEVGTPEACTTRRKMLPYPVVRKLAVTAL
jgi:hypothetical protein